MGSAEKEAERLLADADKEAETKKKAALVEAKDEIHKLRSDAEKELKDRRSEVSRQDGVYSKKKKPLIKKTTTWSVKKKSSRIKSKMRKRSSRKLKPLKKARWISLKESQNLQRIRLRNISLKCLTEILFMKRRLRFLIMNSR